MVNLTLSFSCPFFKLSTVSNKIEEKSDKEENNLAHTTGKQIVEIISEFNEL